MNTLNCCLVILALLVSNVAQASAPPPAVDDNGVNVQNFDSQVIDLFKTAMMFLKNVVYRTDLDVMRVTWGDRKNDYVVKVTYKTGKDKVLSNSPYADKQAVFDVKIIYRKPNAEYDYLRLEDLKSVRFAGNDASIDHDGYAIEYKLSDEKCGFCHTLAKHDGSPSGLFFPRYQEGQGSNGLEGMSAFFDPNKLKLKKKTESAVLGLPEMQDDFYFFHTTQLGIINEDTEKILRTLIELPQLLEVMSMDNHKSYCLLIDTGEIGEKLGLGRDDYICADKVARQLHVKITNDMVFNQKNPITYTEPYFKK